MRTGGLMRVFKVDACPMQVHHSERCLQNATQFSVIKAPAKFLRNGVLCSDYYKYPGACENLSFFHHKFL